ncbi:PilW family protein [Acinetobacter faecalis]|uniref:PilW family protein n=1 Tax=Acinetobacter faecalis TaxID=2665161 RepID=UPI002A91DE1B|nr:PilW family protein [Acinetobacter faecalis]MDY6525017.1 PilW family protein [Acinetobacter faecalis]
MNKHQTGFTLLELMIAIALGLLVVAASLMVFLTGQRSLGMQVGLSDVQQGSNFGLGSMTYDLRHANLNTPSNQVINNKQIGSGVIFANINFPVSLRGMANIDNYLTRESVFEDATTGDSDQLVIQFVPEYTEIKSDIEIEKDGASAPAVQVNAVARNNDCEGNPINFASNNGGVVGTVPVVEKPTMVYRYFIDELPDNQQIAGENTRYGLYCDAGHYFTGDLAIRGMDDDSAQLIIQNVDAFKVRFGVRNSAGLYRYATIDTYKNTLMPATVTAKENYVNVVSIEVGLLMGSSQSIGADASLNTRNTFNVAGHTITLNPNPANSKYLRQEVNQVVGFRNTLGGS